jgi:hypothetical protein
VKRRKRRRQRAKGTELQFAFSVFERALKDFGLPGAIRTDNGAPFAGRRKCQPCLRNDL